MLLIYEIQQHRVQDKMRSAMQKKETTFEKLILSVSEFQKCRVNASEISLNGKMYDIKSIETYGNEIELTVMNDKEEKIILGRINDYVNNTNSSGNGTYQIFAKILSLIYLSSNTNPEFYPLQAGKIIFFSSLLNYSSNNSEVSSPPPRLV